MYFTTIRSPAVLTSVRRVQTTLPCSACEARRRAEFAPSHDRSAVPSPISPSYHVQAARCLPRHPHTRDSHGAGSQQRLQGDSRPRGGSPAGSCQPHCVRPAGGGATGEKGVSAALPAVREGQGRLAAAPFSPVQLYGLLAARVTCLNPVVQSLVNSLFYVVGLTASLGCQCPPFA